MCIYRYAEYIYTQGGIEQLKIIGTKHIKFLPGGGAGGPAGVVEVSSPVPGEIYIYFF